MCIQNHWKCFCDRNYVFNRSVSGSEVIREIKFVIGIFGNVFNRNYICNWIIWKCVFNRIFIHNWNIWKCVFNRNYICNWNIWKCVFNRIFIRNWNIWKCVFNRNYICNWNIWKCVFNRNYICNWNIWKCVFNRVYIHNWNIRKSVFDRNYIFNIPLVWRTCNLSHNSQWITFFTQSCQVEHSFCASFLHSFIMWLTLLCLSPPNLNLLFYYILLFFAYYFYQVVVTLKVVLINWHWKCLNINCSWRWRKNVDNCIFWIINNHYQL